jgi:hypothetical protein
MSGRQCTVCLHISRRQIDEELLAGRSYRDISRQFSVSKDAVARHVAHIPPALAKAREVEIVDAGDELLDHMRDLLADLDHVIEQTKASGDHRTTVLAVREKTRALLVREQARQEARNARAVEQWDEVIRSPEWQQERDAILEIARSHVGSRAVIAARIASLRGIDDAS